MLGTTGSGSGAAVARWRRGIGGVELEVAAGTEPRGRADGGRVVGARRPDGRVGSGAVGGRGAGHDGGGRREPPTTAGSTCAQGPSAHPSPGRGAELSRGLRRHGGNGQRPPGFLGRQMTSQAGARGEMPSRGRGEPEVVQQRREAGGVVEPSKLAPPGPKQAPRGSRSVPARSRSRPSAPPDDSTRSVVSVQGHRGMALDRGGGGQEALDGGWALLPQPGAVLVGRVGVQHRPPLPEPTADRARAGPSGDRAGQRKITTSTRQDLALGALVLDVLKAGPR